jgi:CO/xanthine dehydrogenase FAD-binding subunit
VKVGGYVRPASLDEALAALGTQKADALVVAGGTDLIPLLRRTKHGTAEGDGAERTLVDVGTLPEIMGASEADGLLRVGGAMSMAAIAASPLLNEKAPVLVAAAKTVGSPLVRNRATVGGNLATASPSADTAPALLALDATVRLASAGGVREVPLADFFVGYRATLLRKDELITEILIPVPSPQTAGRFEKVGLRNADAISVVCAAVMLELDGTRCREARIALGAVAPVPVRTPAVEQSLVGREIDEETARASARLVHRHIAPIDDVRGSGTYRAWVTEAVVARAIMRIAAIEEAV